MIKMQKQSQDTMNALDENQQPPPQQNGAVVDDRQQTTNYTTDVSSDGSCSNFDEQRPTKLTTAYKSSASSTVTKSTDSNSTTNIVKTNKVKPASEPSKFSKSYTNFLLRYCHRPLLYVFEKVAGASARNPWRTIVASSVLSILVMVIGINTNFDLYSGAKQWIPTNSPTDQHLDTMKKLSFPKLDAREFGIMLHKEGENVLTKDAVRLVFNTTELLTSIPAYWDICSTAGNVNVTIPTNGTMITTCLISGVMRFWSYQSSFFDANVLNDTDVVVALSRPTYPDGGRVIDEQLFGTPVRDPNTGSLKSALSFQWLVTLPNERDLKRANSPYDVRVEELNFVAALQNLSDSWQLDPRTAGHRLELMAKNSFEAEFQRGIVSDLTLIPYVFISMSLFACIYFYRHDKVQSRCLLAVAATVSVLLSILMGFGFLFIIGVPFTTLTSIVPFILFGVGLDDAFIIVDTYERTSKTKTPVERAHETIENAAISITMTTVSSTVAFSSGIFSTVPAVRWLCLYAAPTIFMVLICQVTFFVACVVLDDRRIRSNRRDCCLCLRVTQDDNNTATVKVQDYTTDFSYRAIKSFCNYILQPKRKFIIVANFLTMFALCSWSASQLKQEFDFNDVLPVDSYSLRGIEALKKYRGNVAVRPQLIFRGVNFGDPDVQDQMEQFVNEIVDFEFVSQQPSKFWLRDFRIFLQNNTLQNVTVLELQSMTFEKQMELFLNDTVYGDLFKDDIGYSKNGTIIQTRCIIEYDKVRADDVKQQMDALKKTENATNSQPINAGLKPIDQKFYLFADQFLSYAFYNVCIAELISNTIFGICSVTIIAMIFVPHWTASLFVLPLVVMMYTCILGVLQWANVPINAVSFISLVMSIGLIVDYVMHVLLKFYETPGVDRKEKVTRTMGTMGASVLAGGFTTVLGTIPLAFSSTGIFWIIFISFLTLVVVALAHGLILLPIILSTFGPEEVLELKVKELTDVRSTDERSESAL
jgi:predicted RND superfamily exporter protein